MWYQVKCKNEEGLLVWFLVKGNNVPDAVEKVRLRKHDHSIEEICSSLISEVIE